ncbi:MAG: hypothetical protein EXR72_21210 [Myxococcales bacterium]|nr:hypothetical protein [Myxococcales bacterium]
MHSTNVVARKSTHPDQRRSTCIDRGRRLLTEIPKAISSRASLPHRALSTRSYHPEVPSATDRIPAPTVLAALPRPERAAACRPFLDAARATVAAAHNDGQSGDATTRAFSSAVDDLVVALFRAALLDPAAPGEGPVCLVAVGGYGRRELCPSSDLDLWFIVDDDRLSSGDPRLASLAEQVLYPRWDLKLDVGHAVRSADDAIAQGQGDPHRRHRPPRRPLPRR